ncbi:MAG: hypothetical protein WDZ40_01750 [Candidatus Spechtbacterales bacterium]
MEFKVKNKVFLGIVVGGVFLLLLVFASHSAYAQTSGSVLFHVDSGFDNSTRSSVSATLRHESERAYFYVEDDYWSSVSLSTRSGALSNLDDIGDNFDLEIYPKVTDVFGIEWTPGIDNDPKTTVLITNMREGIGGYFREEDEIKRTQAPTSNEREILYLNSDFLGNPLYLKSFLAHELQHLIHYNQKNRLLNVREELWVNEMMSEVAPTIAGLNDTYQGSNLQSRVRTFLGNPSDDMTRWNNDQADYGVVSMLGHYLYGRYGDDFFTALIKSDNSGILGINDALESVGADKKFQDVFNNWVIASLVNNCTVSPVNAYCYRNPNLNYNNLHITFEGAKEGGKIISQSDTTFPWQGNWKSYSREAVVEQPDDHVFVLTFNKPQGSLFTVPYAVYPYSGPPQIFYMELSGNSGKFYLEDFGYKYGEVVLMPVLQNFLGNTPLVNYSITAEITETVPLDATKSMVATESAPVFFPDGALVREEGNDRVYIIKNTPEGNSYKRWVQAPQIIDMYGHLSWDNVLVVDRGVLDEYEDVSVIRYTGDRRVYIVSATGEKSWITTEEEFLGLGLRFDMVYEINEREFNFYATL